MMSNCIKLVPKGAHVSDAADLLDEAKVNEFETVIVFGFKEGAVTITASAVHHNLELMGALEAAKQQIWNAA